MRFLIIITTIFLMGCHPYRVTIKSKGTGLNGELELKAVSKKYRFDLKFNQDDWDNVDIGDEIFIGRKTLQPLKQIKETEIYIE